MSRFASHNTPHHDMIHKWISHEWNRQVLCFKACRKYRPPVHHRYLNQKNQEAKKYQTAVHPTPYREKLNPNGFLLDNLKIKQEVPLVNGDYTLGIIDAIIEVTFHRVKTITKIIETKWSKGYQGRLYPEEWKIESGEQYKEVLLCEFKPTLYGHLTEVLQQMNYYETYVKQQYNGQHLTKVLITMDSNKQYDSIIESNGIRIYRILYEDQNWFSLPPEDRHPFKDTFGWHEHDPDYSFDEHLCALRFYQCLDNGFRWEEYNHTDTLYGPEPFFLGPEHDKSSGLFKDLDEYDAI